MVERVVIGRSAAYAVHAAALAAVLTGCGDDASMDEAQGSGADAAPHIYPGSYIEYVERTGHEAPGVRV